MVMLYLLESLLRVSPRRTVCVVGVVFGAGLLDLVLDRGLVFLLEGMLSVCPVMMRSDLRLFRCFSSVTLILYLLAIAQRVSFGFTLCGVARAVRSDRVQRERVMSALRSVEHL